MKLFTSLRSAPWEQRDPERRAAAVREDASPELIAKLPQIAAADEDAGVRRAALSRLSDAALLLERQRTDADAAVRHAALSRLSKLLLDPAAGLTLAQREAALALSLPGELVERVAEAAPEAGLRAAALQKVSRAGFLQKRVVEETDPALREAALARIDGEDVLDRLAEALRTRDKALSRRARDRVQALRLARGDAATLQQYALGLCDTLVAWSQQLPEDIAAKLAQARAQFESRRPQLEEPMQRRVEAYFERVEAALSRRAERVEEARRQAEAPPPVATVDVAPPVAPAPDLTAFDEAMRRAERALSAQKLGEARPAFEQAKALLAGVPKSERGRRERVARAEEKLDELEQWQRWGGNRVRARLCDDVEALIAAAPHPDAVAHRVKELQAEWARVEAAEPGDADRTSGLARRFRALCGRAMAPTRPYFEQRHALREQKREGYETLVAEAAQDKLGGLGAPALLALRRRLADGLRGLDELEPKVRSALARRLRDGLTRVDAALAAQREDAALGRRKLIARLRRELTHADPGVALGLARDAQDEWKRLPRPAREAEAALDAELRALIDPLFAREREGREQAAQEAARIDAESARILAEIAALAEGGAEALAHADGRIAALQAQWRELQAQRPREPAPARERGADRVRGDGRGAGDPRARRDRDRTPGAAPFAARTSGDPRPAPDGRDARNARPSRDGRDVRDPRSPRDGRDARDARSPREGRDGRDARRPERARPVDTDRPFDHAVARVREAQAVQQAARRGARLQAIAAAAALLADVAQGIVAKSDAAWQALELDDADRKRLHPAWQHAAPQDASTLAAHDDALEDWLAAAELDAGLESPPHAQARRRQHQMQRLAVRLQGATAVAADPRERLLQFALLPGGSADGRAEIARRVQRLVEAWSR